MYTCYVGYVFAVIAEPRNHEGVSYIDCDVLQRGKSYMILKKVMKCCFP